MLDRKWAHGYEDLNWKLDLEALISYYDYHKWPQSHVMMYHQVWTSEPLYA